MPPSQVTGNRTFTNAMDTGAALKAAGDRMVAWAIGFPHGPPLAGLLTWIVMLAMVVLTNFRRTKWELFLISHMGSTYYTMISGSSSSSPP